MAMSLDCSGVRVGYAKLRDGEGARVAVVHAASNEAAHAAPKK